MPATKEVTVAHVQQRAREYLERVQAVQNGQGKTSKRGFERLLKREVAQTLKQLRQLGTRIVK